MQVVMLCHSEKGAGLVVRQGETLWSVTAGRRDGSRWVTHEKLQADSPLECLLEAQQDQLGGTCTCYPVQVSDEMLDLFRAECLDPDPGNGVGE